MVARGHLPSQHHRDHMGATRYIPADRAHGDVVVAEDLAAEAHAGQPAGGQDGFFRLGHLGRLAGHKLDAAGGAACVPPAAMQNIYTRIFDSEHEFLSFRRFDLLCSSRSFGFNLRHYFDSKFDLNL